MPTAADLLITGLRQAGTRRLFGVPGARSVAVLAASARAQGVLFICVRSEFAACVMAAVDGELTAAPGAAAIGPGGPAAVAGLAHAWLDRAPMILIADPGLPGVRGAASGSSETRGSGESREAVDLPPLLSMVAKQSLRVSADSVSHWVAHAARLALAEARGPVHLEVPPEVLEEPAVPVAANPRPAALAPPERGRLEAAAAMIGRANRPLILAGLGCRVEDAGWLRALAEAVPAPVLTTLKGKGAIPEPHPLSLGVLTGGDLDSPIIRRADAIIAVGLDAAELEPGAWPVTMPVLHLARAAATGGEWRPVIEVIGEPGLILEELAPLLRAEVHADWDVAEVDRMKRDRTTRLVPSGPGLTPHEVVTIARELSAPGTIAAIDGGAGMLPAALVWQAVGPGECLVPNRLAARGFALPAAIAARLARPDRHVLCFTTPGGLLRVIGELETAARLAAPLVIIVLDEVSPPEVVPAGLAAIARGFGLAAHEAGSSQAVRHAVFEALATGGPVLVHARVVAGGADQG